MNLAVLAPEWLALVFSLLLLAAAVQDAISLKISNIIVVLVIVAAIVTAVVVGPGIALWQNLAVFAALLAIGTPMFAAGKLGGGDVKLLAATGLWFNLKGALWMLLDVVLAGGVVAILIIVLRSLGWSEKIRRRAVILRPGGGIPYGIAIAAGALIAMALQR